MVSLITIILNYLFKAVRIAAKIAYSSLTDYLILIPLFISIFVSFITDGFGLLDWLDESVTSFLGANSDFISTIQGYLGEAGGSFLAMIARALALEYAFDSVIGLLSVIISTILSLIGLAIFRLLIFGISVLSLQIKKAIVSQSASMLEQLN